MEALPSVTPLGKRWIDAGEMRVDLDGVGAEREGQRQPDGRPRRQPVEGDHAGGGIDGEPGRGAFLDGAVIEPIDAVGDGRRGADRGEVEPHLFASGYLD